MLMLKILLLAFCIALVQSGPQYGPHYAPHYTKENRLQFGPLALQAAVGLAAEPYDPAPKYSFGYNVRDSYTGDSKSQHEIRHGDVVKGSYSLVDPDGTKRTVDYIAGPHSGFNAVVRKELLSPAGVSVVPALSAVLKPASGPYPGPHYAAYPGGHSSRPYYHN